MRITTNKNILTILFVCLAGLLSADKLSAMTPVRIDTSRTHLVIPRPALESLPTPLVKSSSDPIDTLDTVNEFIKVILYADNTWQYYKTPDYQTLVQSCSTQNNVLRQKIRYIDQQNRRESPEINPCTSG